MQNDQGHVGVVRRIGDNVVEAITVEVGDPTFTTREWDALTSGRATEYGLARFSGSHPKSDLIIATGDVEILNPIAIPITQARDEPRYAGIAEIEAKGELVLEDRACSVGRIRIEGQNAEARLGRARGEDPYDL